MIDDHDTCEWVNFFLVPAHLGCPGQNPESHKMVVCVCVCVVINHKNVLISDINAFYEVV